MTNCYTITADGITDGINFQRSPLYTNKEGLLPKRAGCPAVWLGGDERDENNRVVCVRIEDAPKGNQLLSGAFKRSKSGDYKIIAGIERDILVCIRTGFPTQLGEHTAVQSVASESPKAIGTALLDFGSWTHEVPDTKKIVHACFDQLWRLTESTSIVVNFANDAFKRYSVKKGVVIETVLAAAKKPGNVKTVRVASTELVPHSVVEEPVAPTPVAEPMLIDAAEAAPIEVKKAKTSSAKKPKVAKAVLTKHAKKAKKVGPIVLRGDFSGLAEVFVLPPAAQPDVHP